jgi:hypothetical protein
MAFVRALHGRCPWPELELHGRPWGSSPERGETGNGRGRGRGGTMGRGCYGGARGLLLCARAFCVCCCVLCVRKRRKARRKRKGRKRKEEKMKKIPNLKIFREKNNRQLMKWVKIIF